MAANDRNTCRRGLLGRNCRCDNCRANQLGQIGARFDISHLEQHFPQQHPLTVREQQQREQVNRDNAEFRAWSRRWQQGQWYDGTTNTSVDGFVGSTIPTNYRYATQIPDGDLYQRTVHVDNEDYQQNELENNNRRPNSSRQAIRTPLHSCNSNATAQSQHGRRPSATSANQPCGNASNNSRKSQSQRSSQNTPRSLPSNNSYTQQEHARVPRPELGNQYYRPTEDDDHDMDDDETDDNDDDDNYGDSDNGRGQRRLA